MSRTPLLLLPFVALLALALAPAAHANGILTTSAPDAPPDRASDGARGPVHLTHHAARVRLVDGVASVTVSQVFHSEARRPLEGTYLFPLPEGAAVSRFAMTMGGKLVEGEILPAAEARRIYEGIVRQRRDPGLLEYVGRGLYRARLFPIPPGGDVTVELAYQQVLPEDDGTLELRYPLASDRFNGQAVAEVLVDVQVEGSVDIKGLYSPSHEVAITRTGSRAARATLERSGRRESRDFLLYVSRSPHAVGLSVLSHRAVGEDGTFMLVLAPGTRVTGTQRLPKDVVYVLDTSGSMSGEKLRQAQAALAQGIRMLRPGDRFDVVAFGSGSRRFSDTLAPADAATTEAAAAWIGRLQARGGTNLELALRDALALPRPDRLAHVVLLTDGRPTVGERDADALVALVERLDVGGARVFTFGVGHDLDVNLLDRIAEGTRGTRDYVAPGEDIEIVTSRFFRKVDEPVLSDVEVDLGPGVHDVVPARVPDLFAGGQVVLFGRYAESGARTIRLTGRVNGEAVAHEATARFAADERNEFLPRLWAHRQVAFLLDAIRLHGEEPELVAEIVRLATRHAIVTPYTAGLVVEEEELQGVASENPLFQIGGRTRRGVTGRGPSGSVPPGLREPTDPTPPPPPSGPPTTPPPTTPNPATPNPTTPATPTAVSRDLRKRKEATAEIDEASWRRIRDKVRTAAGKTFVLRRDGRWVDTAFDDKAEPKRIEAFSKAWEALVAGDAKVRRYLAVGPRVVVVLDGVAIEIVPAHD